MRRIRPKVQGVTGDRAKARANRRLQLIISESHPGERGLTLIEQMELKLDQTLKARAYITDEDERLVNKGMLQGMLLMLSIMRSTEVKTELIRSKARLHYNVHPHSTED